MPSASSPFAKYAVEGKHADRYRSIFWKQKIDRHAARDPEPKTVEDIELCDDCLRQLQLAEDPAAGRWCPRCSSLVRDGACVAWSCNWKEAS